MAEPHPSWGRTLDEYTSSYGIDEAKRRVDLDSNSILEARQAIAKIGDLGGEASQVIQEVKTDQIDLSVLKSVLNLALSPQTFRDFESLALISGCIRLMTKVGHSGKPSVSTSYNPRCLPNTLRAFQLRIWVPLFPDCHNLSWGLHIGAITQS